MAELLRLLAAAACGLFIGAWLDNHFQPIHGYDDLVVYKIEDWRARSTPWVGECYFEPPPGAAYCAADKRSAEESR